MEFTLSSGKNGLVSGIPGIEVTVASSATIPAGTQIPFPTSEGSVTTATVLVVDPNEPSMDGANELSSQMSGARGSVVAQTDISCDPATRILAVQGQLASEIDGPGATINGTLTMQQQTRLPTTPPAPSPSTYTANTWADEVRLAISAIETCGSASPSGTFDNCSLGQTTTYDDRVRTAVVDGRMEITISGLTYTIIATSPTKATTYTVERNETGTKKTSCQPSTSPECEGDFF
jgi:hypothetical protein